MFHVKQFKINAWQAINYHVYLIYSIRKGRYNMLIINMETLPKIIELVLAIYGGVKLVDKLFPTVKQSKFFQGFFN